MAGSNMSSRFKEAVMVRRLCVRVCVVVCVLMLSFAAIAAAQVNTATLLGTVSDPQGLPVQGARLTVTNLVTAAQRTTTTDENGHYNLVGLPPGQYKMTVDGGGNFAVFEKEALAVTVGEYADLIHSCNFGACRRRLR